MSSVFETLNKINVNEHTEKKGQLTYLSWAWAWQVVKANYPKSIYTIYENDIGFNYHTDGLTCWVKVGVTIEDQEHIEYLPVMDYKNKSVPKDQVTSMAVNTAIQRALTKAIARHGLGLYIYAGEDIPSDNPAIHKSYNTFSKATDQDRLVYKKEFMDFCEEHDVMRDDITDFFNFLGVDISDEKEKHNSIVQFLRSTDNFENQLDSYKIYKHKQISA